jgi:hypothetical protein
MKSAFTMARLKTFIVSVLLMTSVSAYAASPEQAYIAARDAAIARLDKMTDSASDDAIKGYKTAEAELTRMLVGIVGPVNVKGFKPTASMSIGSLLTGDMGFGTLDGLTFPTLDDKGSLLVTTEPLYKLWIAEHRSSWESDTLTPPTDAVAELLHLLGFYASAISSDAALYKFGELPVTVPAGATAAVALLSARSQDLTPGQPESIIAALVIGNRLMIAEVPLKATVPAVPACTKIQKAAEARISAAETAYSATDRKDPALGLKLRKLEFETAKAFETCFSDKSKTQKSYQAAIAQAQALLAAMTGQ